MEYDSRLMKTKEFERRTKKLMRLPVKETAQKKRKLKESKVIVSTFLLAFDGDGSISTDRLVAIRLNQCENFSFDLLGMKPKQ